MVSGTTNLVMMTDLVITYLPWLLSGLTGWSMWLAGEKSTTAWVVGLINQMLWFLWIVVSGTWGLLPGTTIITWVFAINYFKWSRSG